MTLRGAQTVLDGRRQVEVIIRGDDDRLLVIVGSVDVAVGDVKVDGSLIGRVQSTTLNKRLCMPRSCTSTLRRRRRI